MSGDLDVATSPLMAGELLDLGLRHLGDGVALDMSDVTFMDCCALGALVHVRNVLHGRLGIRLPSACVRRLLHLTDMTEGLPTLSEPTSGWRESEFRDRSMA